MLKNNVTRYFYLLLFIYYIYFPRKSQLLDNVISKMEKYATNLETIVTARTQQLAEEKGRTDELLHKMLPKYVAIPT